MNIFLINDYIRPQHLENIHASQVHPRGSEVGE